MNKQLVVSKINLPYLPNENEIIEAFQTLHFHDIDVANWSENYPYKPSVKFQIAHNDSFLFLRYHVQEEFLKAQFIRANENVWEDSCVEFFLSLDDKKTYFNFEFNVLGTGLIGYGPAIKSERNRLTAEQIDRVDAYVHVTKVNGKKEWTSLMIIPKDLFGDMDFSGKIFHGNFYKCGDGLPQPHFLSWNKIDHPAPNFHLPEYFGNLIFE